MSERRRSDRRNGRQPFLGVERREADDRRTRGGHAPAEARHVAENAAALSVLFAQLESAARAARSAADVEAAARSVWVEIEERLSRIRP